MTKKSRNCRDSNVDFRNNICYGATNPEEISDEEIIEMAKKSNALEFINQLPDGLDTQIGERESVTFITENTLKYPIY